MVKCACGCGQEITGPKVGVPTGEGDFIAFIPEHHLGPQIPIAESGGGLEPICADNPRMAVQKRGFKGKKYMIYFYDPADDFGKKWRRWYFDDIKKAKDWRAELGIIWDTPVREIPIQDMSKHWKNALPIGQIAKLAGVKARVSVGENPSEKCWKCGRTFKPKSTEVVCPSCHKEMTSGMGWSTGPGIENPGRPTQEFWRKTYFPIYWYYRKRRGFSATRAKKAAGGTTASIWHYKISPSKKRQYEAMRRLREGRGRIRINAAGTINVDGSRITEVRYVESGTGQKWKHRLVRPVRMRVRGGKVHIPPLTVKREGITQ